MMLVFPHTSGGEIVADLIFGCNKNALGVGLIFLGVEEVEFWCGLDLRNGPGFCDNEEVVWRVEKRVEELFPFDSTLYASRIEK